MSKLDVSQQQSVVELARNGNFRALAYWLNSQLVPQGIYVQVQAARPGCLQAVVEFHRKPIRDRLVRFICHRLWQLESDLIEGVHILARHIGQSDFIWQQTVRIPTRTERRQRQQGPQTVDVKARAAHIPPKISNSSSPAWLTLTFSSQQQLKLVRSFMLSGSAIAAFLMGFWLEHLTARPSPTLPVISKTNPTSRVATNRPSTVQAALETVAVLQHEDVKNPYDSSVTLMFGGEVSPADFNVGAAETAGGLLAELDATQSADLSMVSLAEPLANAATSLEEEMYDRTRSESAAAFKQSGIDIVNLADDQIVDYGEAGLLETIKSLDQAGIYRMGAGRDVREARRPEIIDVKGQRVAYLGYSGADWLAAERGSAGINPQEQTTVAEDIKAIREQVDWIVVSYRWSEELSEDQVEDWQKDMARFAIDQGADLVVGQHPDVLQGAEVYKGRPIAYSLGDLMLEDDPYAEFDTAVLKVSLKPDQMKVEFVPVTVKDGHPQLAKGRQGKAILDRIHQSSATFEQPLEVPVVLDLRQPETEPERPVDSSAPFVDPNAPEMEILNPDAVEDGFTPEEAVNDEAEGGTELQSPLKENKLDNAPTDEFAPAEDSFDQAPASGPMYFGDPNLNVQDQPAFPDAAPEAAPPELDNSKLKNSELESPELERLEPNNSELEDSKSKELEVEDSEAGSEINPFNPFNSLDSNNFDSLAVPELDGVSPESVSPESVSPEFEDNPANLETPTPDVTEMAPVEVMPSELSRPNSDNNLDIDAVVPEMNSDGLQLEEPSSPIESSVEIQIPDAEPAPGASAEAPAERSGETDTVEQPDASGAIEPVEEPLVGPLVNQPLESNPVAAVTDVPNPHQAVTNEEEDAIALNQLEVALNTEITHLNASDVQTEPKFKAPTVELKLPKLPEPQLPNRPARPADSAGANQAAPPEVNVEVESNSQNQP
ncbi:MAG: CapA family protein [Thainema sp.]